MQSRHQWNQRYSQPLLQLPEPCALLQTMHHCLPGSGKALDLACGLGGNALYLAGQGFDVTAVDFSAIALKRLAESMKQKKYTISLVESKAEDFLPQENQFDVIVVSYFLQRSCIEPLLASLKSGGLLFYQTFYEEKVLQTGSNNPDYVLKTNELLEKTAGLIVRYYRQSAPFEAPDLPEAHAMMLLVQKP